MLERVPTVPMAQELLDQAFSRASKLQVPDPVKYHRIRKTEASRLASAVDTVAEPLERVHRAFPNLDAMRTYETEVLDIVVGLAPLRKALGSVRWAAEQVREVGREAQGRILRSRTIDGFFKARKRAYGRISSILEDIEQDLAFLSTTRDHVRHLPTVSPDFATVVIAGYPNVGKTSLLRAWTNSRAAVDQYAFTTQRAEVGHFEVEGTHGIPTQYQVVDTPGLLDRPDAERNEIERQALAALRHAADVVLFLLDPTEVCGFSREQQEHLLEQVRADMAGVPLLVAETKADLLPAADADTPPQGGRFRISTATGEGLDAVRQAILDNLRFEEDLELEEDPLLRWKRGDAD